MRRRYRSQLIVRVNPAPSPRFLVDMSRLFRSPVAPDPLLDRRTYHPAGSFLRPVSAKRAHSRLVIPPSADLSHRIGFAVPNKVAVCVRRQQRKEVIHALGLTGRGAGARVRRRGPWSDVEC